MVKQLCGDGGGGVSRKDVKKRADTYYEEHGMTFRIIFFDNTSQY